VNLHPKRHGRHFWQRWQEAQTSGQQPDTEWGNDPRKAWRKHFADFLGVEPEDHWLFSGRRFKSWASGEWGPPGLFNPFVAMVLSKGGGLLSLYVLHLLAERPRYGNDIMNEIEERTHGRWGANPGAVYPMLNDMEEAGFVEGEWEDPEKRTRRIYRITPKGQLELDRLKEVMRPKLEEAIGILRDLFQDLEKGDEF
jgi:DNA-binding PadR family transcriptional regulator